MQVLLSRELFGRNFFNKRWRYEHHASLVETDTADSCEIDIRRVL
jgi:hypothetical protein